MVGSFKEEIRCIKYLCESDMEFVAHLVAHLKPLKYFTNEIIVDEGDYVNNIVFITEGEVKVMHRVPSLSLHKKLLAKACPSSSPSPPLPHTSPSASTSSTSTLKVIGAFTGGSFFGEVEFVRHGLSLFRYTAACDSNMFSISYQGVREAMYCCGHEGEDFLKTCRAHYSIYKEVIESWIDPSRPEYDPRQLTFVDGSAEILRREARRSSDLKPRGRVFKTMIDYSGQLHDETRHDLWRRGIIHPDSSGRFAWDIFIGLLVIYGLVYTAVAVGFSVDRTLGMKVTDWVVDAFFFLDMVCVSRTAYLMEDVLVTIPSKIFRRYLRCWFWIDLVSTVPFDDLLAFSSSSLGSLRVVKVLRLIRILRLFKLNRFAVLLIWMQDNLFIHPGIIDMGIMSILIAIGAHVTGCLWWYLGGTFSRDSWFRYYKYEGLSLLDQYLASLYWAYTTLSTIGYGDIVAVNAPERIVACCFMLLGGVALGYVVGNITEMIATVKSSDMKRLRRLEKVRCRFHFSLPVIFSSNKICIIIIIFIIC